MRQRPSGVLAGMVEAVPLVLGYFPIAFSFGVAATRAGMSGWEALALSVIVFAGASQFLAIALVTGGTPFWLGALIMGAMNLRHVLYGPVVLARAGGGARRFAALWSFVLTDEVFGAALGAMARGMRFSEGLMAGLGFSAYAAWVLGTGLGAWAGGGALEGFPAVAAGLDFMLPALFLALLLSILNRRQVPVILVAGVATVIGTWEVSGTVGLLAGMVSGALWGVMRRGEDAV